MWLLMVNGLIYLITGFATGRFRKKLLPITPTGVFSDIKAALTFRLAHDDISKYNYVQKVLYAGIIAVGVVIVLSGLSIWKPVQLHWLVSLFGGYDWARYVHFFCMSAIALFLIGMSCSRRWCRRACAPDHRPVRRSRWVACENFSSPASKAAAGPLRDDGDARLDAAALHLGRRQPRRVDLADRLQCRR